MQSPKSPGDASGGSILQHRIGLRRRVWHHRPAGCPEKEVQLLHFQTLHIQLLYVGFRTKARPCLREEGQLMRFVCLFVGVCLLIQAASNGWQWYGHGTAEAEAISGSQRQLLVAAGMALLGSGCIAAGIAARKEAGLEGFFCGLLGGPVGVVLAMFIDNRPKCPHCSARMSVKATYCRHCQIRRPPKPSLVPDKERLNPDGLRNSDYREKNENQTNWLTCREMIAKRKSEK
jgi:hypothetical protein